MNVKSYIKKKKKSILGFVGFTIVGFLAFTVLFPFFDKRLDASESSSNLLPASDSGIVGDEPFNSTDNLGYELLDDGSVFHMWNNYDSYYFNRSNGIQFSNHYEEYWTHNVLMLGYYSGGSWNLLYRVDELDGFTEVLDCVTEDYINVTLWKNLSYGSYDFRLALRYHLKVNDSDLTIIPYIKNLGIAIPFDIGFGWEIKDIKIVNTVENDFIRINRTSYYLNQTLDNKYTNLSFPVLNETNATIGWTTPIYKIIENLSCGGQKYLYLMWDKDLDYLVWVKNRTGQYNAPVTLFIKVGALGVGQEKHTMMHWYDSEVTYYFNDYDNGGEEWTTTPERMVDNNLANYARANVQGDVELCDGNTCDGTGLVTISKVELRAYCKRGANPADVYLRPVFTGGDGNNHELDIGTSGAWSSWQDITTDDNAPSSWTWTDITNLDCDVDAFYISMFANTYCAKVEIRVTFNIAPIQSGESPNDKNINDTFPSEFSVYCSDVDGDTMNLTWSSNSSGAWVDFGTNSSIGNGTYYQTNNDFSEYNKTYWWNVSLNDGMGNWDNNTYSFKIVEWLCLDDGSMYEGRPYQEQGQRKYLFLGDSTYTNISCFFKFDITNIPVGQIIDSVILYVYVDSEYFEADEGHYAAAYHIYNYSLFNCNNSGEWVEGDSAVIGEATDNELCWGERPLSGEYNMTNESYNVIQDGDSTKWFSWNITEMTTVEYDAGHGNVSIWLKNDSGIGVIDADYNNFLSSEYNVTNLELVPYINITYHAAAANNAPTFANEAPTNQSTGLSLMPQCYVVCNDTDGGDTLDVDFYDNTSGSYVWRDGWTGQPPATNLSFNFSQASNYSTTYYWRVFSNDGTDNSSDTYHFTTEANIAPTFSDEAPTNQSTGLGVTPSTVVYVVVTDGNSDNTTCDFYTSSSDSPYSWTWKQTNSSVTTGLNISYVYGDASSYDTTYYWMVTANDSFDNSTSEFYEFTTEAEASRSPTEVFNYWFNCSNTSQRNPTEVFNYWFDCGNTSQRVPTEVFNHWFDCGNTSSRTSTEVFNYWFECGNTSSRIPTEIFNYWFNCSNVTGVEVRQPTEVFNYWFLCGNTSQRVSTEVFNHWFNCGNVSEQRTPTLVFDHWFDCGNTSVRTPTEVFNYWFECNNVSEQRVPIEVFNYWFNCSNVSEVRTPTLVFDYWFLCANGTGREPTQVFDYWFNCGNVTEARSPTLVFDYWFDCGNTSYRTSTEVFNYWFDCSNTSSRIPTEIFNYWFECGNTSQRNPTEVFNYWFNCSNVTGVEVRQPTEVFNYWFDCGNVSEQRVPTEVFNYWFSCGNVSVGGRTPTEVFNYWFNCGNVSLNYITISDIYPSDNAFGISLQPIIYITINQTYGEMMNVSWYYGLTLGSENILLGTDTNIVNSTQTEIFYPVSSRSTTYYWRVMADDGTTYINETYSFKTEGYPGGGGGFIPRSTNIIGVLGLLGLIGVIIIFWKKKKEGDKNEF